MSTNAQFDQVWGSTQPGDISDDNPPPAGYLGIPVVTEGKLFQSAKGETTMVVEFRDEQNGYSWADVRVLTKNGIAKEGAIKAAKVLLRQLGIDTNLQGAQVHTALQHIIGTYYSVEQKASSSVNPNTGEFYTNTIVNSKASPPAQAPTQPVSQDLPWDGGSAPQAPPPAAPVPADPTQFQQPAPPSPQDIDPQTGKPHGF